MNLLRCAFMALPVMSGFVHAQTPTPTPEMTFFVTSIGSLTRSDDSYVGGNLGGLAGADALCQELGSAAGHPEKLWRAYLSTSTVNARDRIGSGPWYNSDGELIANNVAELHANGIPAALVKDENGNPVPPSEHDILTGASQDGGLHPLGANCEDFTSSHPEVAGTVGHSDGGGVGQGGIDGGSVSISWNSAHLTACDEAGIASTSGSGRVYAFFTGAYIPTEIAVEQPAATGLTSGGSREFVLVTGTTSLTFTILNTGGLDLTGLQLEIAGEDASLFSITTTPSPPVKGGGGTTTFTVQFAPTSTGTKTAVLRIWSNDADENPFTINLVGHRLSFSEDADGDGMNDASEFQLAALGFNWRSNQSGLVNTYYANANGAGLYTASQVQAMHVGTPLLTRDSSGEFTLTIGVRKSTDLAVFSPFPMSPAQTTIDEQGELRFKFSVSDNAAFFLLQAR